jgi:prepilin-type processing-associated H-X9-DG protein
MPGLQMAREQANRSVCLSHLRQLGIATQMYIHKTDGYMPIFGEWRDPPAYKYARTDPFMGPTPGQPEVTKWSLSFGTPMSALIKTRCVDGIEHFIQACPTSKSKVLLSYGYNYGQLGSASSVYGEKRYGDEWVKADKVTSPSETGMYCDGSTVGDLDTYPRKGSYGIGYWEPKFWPDYKSGGGRWGDSDPFNWTKMQIIGHNRGTKINVNFVDGHVASLPVGECHGKYSHDKDVYIWKRDKGNPF